MNELKKIRVSRGVTLTHMAHLLGYKSVSSYRKLETGETILKADQLMIIAREFNIKPEKILGKSYSKRIRGSAKV